MTIDDNPRQVGTPNPHQIPTKSNPNLHHFWFEGRKYKLVKRVEGRNSPWYLEAEINTVRLHKTLETNVAAAAQARAVKLITEAKQRKWGAGEAVREQKPATLKAIFEAYEKFAVQHVKERTAHNNIASLRLILGRALDLPAATLTEKTNALTAEVLTAQLIRRFREKFLTARLAGLEGDDLARARNAAFISGTSYLSQGRSVFNRAALTHYEDLGLHIPKDAIAEFRAEPPFKRVGADYMPASDAVVSATFAAIAAKTDDPNLVAAFWLATGAGLRKGEIARAKWGHITNQQGKPWFDSDIPGKDHLPIKVPLLTFAATALAALRHDKKDADTILQGSATECRELVFRRIGPWMSSLGWASEKKVHELRAWAGSKIIETHGMEAASNWMRHKEMRTTQLKYGRYVKIKAIDIQLPK